MFVVLYTSTSGPGGAAAKGDDKGGVDDEEVPFTNDNAVNKAAYCSSEGIFETRVKVLFETFVVVITVPIEDTFKDVVKFAA